ncbi:MAG: sensor histidine kinase [Bacteroidia bacterium]
MKKEEELAFIPDTYFQQLALSSTDHIMLLDPVDFKIRYMNRKPSVLMKEEMTGREASEFVATEFQDSYKQFLLDVRDTEEARCIELESSDLIRDAKGNQWFLCCGYAIKNQAGKTESILITSKNITSARFLNNEIRNKEEKLYAILNNTGDVILSIDTEFLLTEYNSVFSGMIKKGYGKENLRGTSVLDYIDPSKHSRLKKIYSEVLNGRVATDIDKFETRSGLTLYCETSYHPIRNFQQEITGISIFSKDISERIKNEQALQNTLKEREVLLAEIHHRIKNNLALVSSMLQLKEMNMEHEEAREALSDSRKRIRSTALIHEMLYRNETFDKVVLSEYLSELFKNLNINPGITLVLKGDNPVFELNKALPLGLMMHELMMNSFKHSFKNNKPARLEITTTINNKTLELEYCDCSGVFPETVNFYDTTSTGLMLIHTFAEQLEGSIKLISHIPPIYHLQIPLL